MSLLLEALKKAEKAKEEAQRRAKGGDAPAIDPEATVVDARQLTGRAAPPDTSVPLEILGGEPRPRAPVQGLPRELALAADPPAAAPAAREPGRESARAASAGPARNTERATAQRVFEAKFREPNPRLPFFITVGVLGAFAIGTVFYFWIQLRPPAPLVNANPVRSVEQKAVETAAAPAPSAATSTAGAAVAALPGLPQAAPAQSVPPPAAAAPTATPAPSAAAAAPAAALARPARREPAAAGLRSEERPVSVSRGGPQIHPQVAGGYAAYQAGDLPKARAEYQQVLREEPANRDALLGIAAVEMRAQRYDLADSYYQRILQADPRDAHAQAGMISLRGQQLDPVQVESRMKSLIAADRNANVLQFTLGNQYAQQGRWAEAQQAYFKAFAADPENPDFAFNLAVSLDQLHQSKLALEYYRRALLLAEKRSAGFAVETARTRAQQLSRY